MQYIANDNGTLHPLRSVGTYRRWHPTRTSAEYVVVSPVDYDILERDDVVVVLEVDHVQWCQGFSPEVVQALVDTGYVHATQVAEQVFRVLTAEGQEGALFVRDSSFVLSDMPYRPGPAPRHPAPADRLTDDQVLELADMYYNGGHMPNNGGWFMKKPHQMLQRALRELAALRGLCDE